MATYVVLVPEDDEAGWAAASAAERQRVYDGDQAFAALLQRRGGRITGGAGLAASREALTLRRGTDGAVVVTEGPYAETVEQLSGFFVVECDELDVLQECLQPMVAAHGVVEVRPVAAEEES